MIDNVDVLFLYAYKWMEQGVKLLFYLFNFAAFVFVFIFGLFYILYWFYL